MRLQAEGKQKESRRKALKKADMDKDGLP